MVELIGNDGLPAFIHMHMANGLLARLVQLRQSLQRRPALGLSLQGNARICLSRSKILAQSHAARTAMFVASVSPPGKLIASGGRARADPGRLPTKMRRPRAPGLGIARLLRLSCSAQRLVPIRYPPSWAPLISKGRVSARPDTRLSFFDSCSSNWRDSGCADMPEYRSDIGRIAVIVDINKRLTEALAKT